MLWSARSRMCGSPRSLLQHAELILFACFMTLWYRQSAKMSQTYTEGNFLKTESAEFGLLVKNPTLLVNKMVRCSQHVTHKWSFAWLDMRLGDVSGFWVFFAVQWWCRCCFLALGTALWKGGGWQSLPSCLWKAASAQVAAEREGGEGGGLQGRWRLRVSGEKQGADMWLGLERVERKRFFCW